MTIWPVVMQREILVKLRDRNFVIGTLVTVALLVATFALQAFIAGKSNEVSMAVSGDGARAVAAQVQQDAQQRGDSTTITIHEAASPDAVAAQVNSGEAGVGLVHASGSWELIGKTGVAPTISAYVTEAVRDQAIASNAAAAGTSVEAITAGSVVTPRLLQPDTDPGLRTVTGIVFGTLFYVASLLFGMSIAQSVVEEKQSRVVEILVSAVPLRQLLAGKVLGNVVLAVAQMVLFVSVGIIGLSFSSYASQLGSVAASAGWYLVFFLAGFGALACLWAVAGSLATRNEDLQSTTPVLTTVLMIAFFAGFVGEGTVRTVGSYVPVVSTVTMPQRLLAGDAAWWEPLVSLAITLAFAAWTVVLGERLYRRSIMHTGRRLKVREALRQSA